MQAVHFPDTSGEIGDIVSLKINRCIKTVYPQTNAGNELIGHTQRAAKKAKTIALNSNSKTMIYCPSYMGIITAIWWPLNKRSMSH